VGKIGMGLGCQGVMKYPQYPFCFE